jgi:hypothetical protein
MICLLGYRNPPDTRSQITVPKLCRLQVSHNPTLSLYSLSSTAPPRLLLTKSSVHILSNYYLDDTGLFLAGVFYVYFHDFFKDFVKALPVVFDRDYAFTLKEV